MRNKNDLASVTISREQLVEYEQLNTFFLLSGDWLCVAGFDGYFKKINPAVSKLLGYTEEELLASPINDFVYGPDKQVTIGSRQGVYKGVPLRNFENRYQTKSGEVVWLSWTSVPSMEGQLVFAIAKNVTEKKRQEEERNIFIENLTTINQDLQQLTRMTSHDMRSPVNNLLAIFSILDVSRITDTETSELIQLLKATSEHLNDTVNNFVEGMIKTDQTVSVEELRLSACLNTVTASIGSVIMNSLAHINVDFTAFNTIPFNKIYMESILLNLITNAIKYVIPDNIPRISIYTRIAEGRKQLVISDQGMGFDMEIAKDRIFRLYQVFTDRPDSKGIGLHLVYTHVTAMGGQITIDSAINKGTTFIITFKN